VTPPVVTLSLEDSRTAYQPGEALSGEYCVEAADGADLQAVEISVLWSTEGRGDEDMAVHFFERVTVDEAAGIDLRQPRKFRTVLPNSPLSYDGVIVKLRWCVRIRAFLARGKQVVEERPFRLGIIPPARAVLP